MASNNLEMVRPVNPVDFSDSVSRYVVPSRLDKDGREVPVQPVYDVYDRPWGRGRPLWKRDMVVDTPSKTFTVPKNCFWEIQYIGAYLATTATVGNRFPTARFGNGVNTIVSLGMTSVVVASKTALMEFSPGRGYSVTPAGHATAGGVVPNVYLGETLPACVLPAGYTLDILDSAGISATDDLCVNFAYVEYDC